ncbi:unnamed protein product [Spirodela intermedia]|uniref:Bifunctional inhibitor/plant lipid transfer protein/seed storage helical domain-containing protein n=2 Tax=Spirodela intermedia TaxID=51605 RepID=A0A7I8JF65_SPIIN|nr:unnamed protein product [Spirodela intermedia]CAA6668183.1 unnamed protein product [Spirodela intermedia]CAA7405014.1 unnamed protein product [Spirodela intermedia]
MEKKMATSALVLLVAVLAVGHLGGEVEAQQVLCNVSQEGLLACKSAVTRPNPAIPSSACCAAVANADLQCLCNFKNTNPGAMRFMGIDPELAMQLPNKCSLPTPVKC